jgi:hypothetical protein
MPRKKWDAWKKTLVWICKGRTRIWVTLYLGCCRVEYNIHLHLHTRLMLSWRQRAFELPILPYQYHFFWNVCRYFSVKNMCKLFFMWYLSIHLSTSLFIYLSNLPTYLFIYLFFYLSTFLPFYLSIPPFFLSINQSINQSVNQPINQSVNQSVNK